MNVEDPHNVIRIRLVTCNTEVVYILVKFFNTYLWQSGQLYISFYIEKNYEIKKEPTLPWKHWSATVAAKR